MPRRGQLSVRDLRAVYGSALREMSTVDVFVLAEDDGVPVAARVELGESRWGWNHVTMVVCPTCHACRNILVARAGKLQCTGCHRQRTRQQLEKRRADWVRRGAREEDRMLRLLQQAVQPTESKVREVARLVHEIVAADHARLDLLRRQLGDLTAYMSMPR
jgi:hypothetical protein